MEEKYSWTEKFIFNIALDYSDNSFRRYACVNSTNWLHKRHLRTEVLSQHNNTTGYRGFAMGNGEGYILRGTINGNATSKCQNTLTNNQK
jgi:hypothetical protein